MRNLSSFLACSKVNSATSEMVQDHVTEREGKDCQGRLTIGTVQENENVQFSGIQR